jgi:hypothetical protein
MLVQRGPCRPVPKRSDGVRGLRICHIYLYGFERRCPGLDSMEQILP